MKTALIADDHPLVRTAINDILKKEFAIGRCDQAANEMEIRRHLTSKKYDFITLDVSMPHTNFSRILKHIKIQNPKADILVISMQDELIYGPLSISLGANGFLSKSSSKGVYLSAFSKVLAGKRYISECLEEVLVHNINTPPSDTITKLSQREMEVAKLLTKGYKMKEVCTALNINYSTCNTYKKRVFAKLNIYNLRSLATWMEVYDINKD